MSQRVRIIVAVVVGLAVVAAGVYALTGGEPRKYLQLGELAAQESQWKAQSLSSYEMTLGIGCFCPFFDRMPLTVQVRDGQVVSVLDSQGQPVAADDPIRSFGNEQLMTIDGAFAYARDRIHDVDEIKITYDPLLGYPTSLNIDRIKMAIDDELSVSIENVQPLP